MLFKHFFGKGGFILDCDEWTVTGGKCLMLLMKEQRGKGFISLTLRIMWEGSDHKEMRYFPQLFDFFPKVLINYNQLLEVTEIANCIS